MTKYYKGSPSCRRTALKGLWHLPYIHLLWDRFIAYDLRSHPGHRASKGHLGALVTELFGCAEIRNLHWVIVGDQHAGIKHWGPSLHLRLNRSPVSNMTHHHIVPNPRTWTLLEICPLSVASKSGPSVHFCKVGVSRAESVPRQQVVR